jgi:hypothetical protein
MTINISALIDSFQKIIDSQTSTAGAQAAQAGIDASNQFAKNQLSQSEYQEIIGDIKTEQLINVEAQNLVLAQELSSIFTTILSATSIMNL